MNSFRRMEDRTFAHDVLAAEKYQNAFFEVRRNVKRTPEPRLQCARGRVEKTIVPTLSRHRWPRWLTGCRFTRDCMRWSSRVEAIIIDKQSNGDHRRDQFYNTRRLIGDASRPWPTDRPHPSRVHSRPTVLFFSRPRSEGWLASGHTMDVLSPFIPVLCHSDWLFHGESCCHGSRLDVVHPGRARPSSPSCTWHVPCIISFSTDMFCFCFLFLLSLFLTI